MVKRRAVLASVIALIIAGICSIASSASARPYYGISDWKAIAAGGDSTCGIRNTGSLHCWGVDGSGRMLAPISSARDWTSLDAGLAHRCALRSTGILYCWGSDSAGQLGNGAGGSTTVTTRITTATDWKSISAGDNHTCGIRTASRFLYCWGSDVDGQLGNGSGGSADAPTQITGAMNWNAVSAGKSHTCAIRNGGLLCWGSDANGQSGNGPASSDPVSTPAVITTATDWKSVSTGDAHSCAIRSAGLLYCWGSDAEGQLGNGSGGSADAPVRVTSATDWKSVTAGANHTCAIRGSGILYCWGSNDNNQTIEGGGSDVDYPQRISGYTDWRSSSAGQNHTCAARGILHCWGLQKAPSDVPGTAYPAQILNLKPWKLTTPVDGSDAGTVADEIKQPALATFRNFSFFFANSDNSGVVFRTPVAGARTPGSVFVRTELREMRPYTGTSPTTYNWSNASGTHTMTMRAAITHVPPRRSKVVIGQIHDPTDEVLMIRVDRKSDGNLLLHAQARYSDTDYRSKTLIDNYQLGTRFTVSIVATSAGITPYINGTSVGTFGRRAAAANWYFKAGCYLQTNTSYGESASEYGESIIYSLGISHR